MNSGYSHYKCYSYYSRYGLALLSYCLDSLKALLALGRDSCPVLCSDDLFREELAAHAYAENACLEPFLQILFLGSHAAGNHDFRPRHRSHQALDEVRSYHVAGEHLREVAAYLLRRANL